MNLNPIIIFIFSFALISCSTPMFKGERKTQTEVNENPYEDATDAELLNEEIEPEQIIGSAEIEKHEEHQSGTYFLYGAEHLGLENNYFDIPVKYNKQVKKWINYFTGRGRKSFLRYSSRAGRYAPVMAKILEEYGLPKDLIFVATAESGFRNTAKSWAKAVTAPWQFMPFTGRKFGLKIDWYVDEKKRSN